MTNTWLCTRSKLLQICQIRSLTNLSWFQNRSNTISLDLGSSAANFQEDGCLLKTNSSYNSVSPVKFDHPFSDWSDRNFLLQTADGSCGKPAAFNTMSKYDILTFLRPLGVRNQDLIRSLAKIVEPVECNDTIHVGSLSKNNSQPLKTCNKANVHAFNSFDAFSAVDQHAQEDFGHCVYKNASNAAVKTNDSSWRVKNSVSGSGGKDPNKDDDRKGPTIEQLETVKEYYMSVVPSFHKRGEQLRAGLHHKDITFENHLFKKPKVTVGLATYSFELTKIRVLATLLYPSYYLEVQSLTSHPVDGYVKMHWRAYTLSNLKFVRHLPAVIKGIISGDGAKTVHDSFDGISTFYLNKDGKIVLHRVDRKIPIHSEVNPVKNLAAKTVEMVGLSPKSSCESTSKENLS